MKFGSLFAGLGGIDLALTRAGMSQAWACEIDPQCNSVRRRHWPDEVTIEDVHDVKASARLVRPDIIAGGFPCQNLSVAGRRAGLAGKQSGLWFEFHRVIGEFRPRWVLIENVPGLLSSWSSTTDPPSGVPTAADAGRSVVLVETSDFDTVTRGLEELGYGWSARVLNAEWFGVPQRRRRVFIVGCAGGDWRSAAEVLFERESLPWDTPPRREAWTDVAPCARGGTASGSNEHGNEVAAFGGNRTSGELDVATTCNAHGGTGRHDFESETFVVSALDQCRGGADDNDAQGGRLVAFNNTGQGWWNESAVSATVRKGNLQGNGEARIATVVAFSSKDDCRDAGNIAPTLRSMNFDQSHLNGGGQVAVAFKPSHFTRGKDGAPSECVPPLSADDDKGDQEPLVLCQNGSDIQVSEVPGAVTAGMARQTSGDLVGVTGVSKPMIVRRLTPTECERLQGLPDGFTKYGHDGRIISDSARYRMIGNSVAVPVVRWIADRIVQQDQRPQ